MRWKCKSSNPRPQHGARVTLKGFLFLPKTINFECRWLEIAEWEVIHHRYGYTGYLDEWKDERWISD